MVKRVIDEQGIKHDFPDDATDQEINEAIDQYQSANKPIKAPAFGMEPNTEERVAQSPGVQGILGAGDAIVKALSAGKMAPQTGSGTAYDVGGIAGSIAPYLVGEEALVGSKALSKLSPLVRRLIAAGASTGTQAAMQSPDNRAMAFGEGAGLGAGVTGLTNVASRLSPIVGAPLRAGIGAALGYGIGGKTGAEIGGATGVAAPLLVPKLAEALAKKNAMEGVNLQASKPLIDAANRLQLKFITPGEAFPSPFVGAAQGAAGKTGEGAQLMYKEYQDRLQSEKKAISDLRNTIFDEKSLAPEVKKLYESSAQEEISPQKFNALTKNSIINDAVNKADNDITFKDELAKYPKNSIGYLDIVKRKLDDMAESAEGGSQKFIKDARRNLVESLDKISPDYQRARNLAERQKTLANINKKLNEEEISGTNFYQKILRNDQSFNDLQRSLRNVPEAQEKLRDMRLVFKNLINPQTAKNAANMAERGTNQDRNGLTVFKDLVKSLNGRKYDTAFINTITDPKWHDEFTKIANEKSSGKQALAFSNLISKISAQGINQ